MDNSTIYSKTSEDVTCFKKASLQRKMLKQLDHELYILRYKATCQQKGVEKPQITTSGGEFNNTLSTKNQTYSELKTITGKNYKLKNIQYTKEKSDLYLKEKHRMRELQIKLKESKLLKAETAKRYKEDNRLIKENIYLLKEKINEENKQKRKIILSKIEIMKNTIKQYKELKKNYVRGVLNDNLEKDMLKLRTREKEREHLKQKLEVNKI